MLTQFPYEIKLSGSSSIAKTLAYWDRLSQKQIASGKAQNQRSIVRLAA